MRIKQFLINSLLAVAFICGCLFVAKAHAEYRVFILKIEDATTGQARTVTTTLDHLQYHEYYPVQATERVSIQDTWMCKYYRSDISQDIDQKYCENPKAAPAPAAPAAQP